MPPNITVVVHTVKLDYKELDWSTERTAMAVAFSDSTEETRLLVEQKTDPVVMPQTSSIQ